MPIKMSVGLFTLNIKPNHETHYGNVELYNAIKYLVQFRAYAWKKKQE